jgi:hypothetical protein
MNEVIFNEGGQPVYLDDLQIIQATALNQLHLLIQFLTNNSTAVLLFPYKTSQDWADETQTSIKVTFHYNYLVYCGAILRVDTFTTIFDADSGEPPVLAVFEQQDNNRVHADGQTRPCLKRMYAKWTYDTAGAVYASESGKVPESVIEILAKRINDVNKTA